MRRELELNVGLHLRLKDLQSSNIVRYLGFEIFRGQIVMVMEYMQEGSLRDRIGRLGRQKPLPIDDAIRITEDVLKGLAVIHRERVFHRDIKPENILFQARTAKIADLRDRERCSTPTSSPAPESARPITPPGILEASGGSFTSDIWSLAVTRTRW
jgi:serine/threonine protein kinase